MGMVHEAAGLATILVVTQLIIKMRRPDCGKKNVKYQVLEKIVCNAISGKREQETASS